MNNNQFRDFFEFLNRLKRFFSDRGFIELPAEINEFDEGIIASVYFWKARQSAYY